MAAVPLPFDGGIGPGLEPRNLHVQRIEHRHVAFGSTHDDTRPSGGIRAFRTDVVQRIVEFHDVVAVCVASFNFGNVGFISGKHVRVTRVV